MIIYAGETKDYTTTASDGGIFDPLTNKWKRIPSCPWNREGRTGHVAVIAGNRMIAWGGHIYQETYPFTEVLDTGEILDFTSITWLPIATGKNVIDVRSGCTAIWTGNEMIIWGGYDMDLTTMNSGGLFSHE